MPNTPHSSRGPSRSSNTTGRSIAAGSAPLARRSVHPPLRFPRGAQRIAPGYQPRQGGTRVSRSVRMLLASALGALGLGAMAGPASAGIWSEIPSGTTEEITAIEYQGADRFWYATGSGKIF